MLLFKLVTQLIGFIYRTIIWRYFSNGEKQHALTFFRQTDAKRCYEDAHALSVKTLTLEVYTSIFYSTHQSRRILTRRVTL